MNVRITSKSNTGLHTVEEDGFYEFIAKEITNLSPPDHVLIDTPYGSAGYDLIQKGGGFFVREEYNNISILDKKVCNTVYLVCVNPLWNNYKFYKQYASDHRCRR